VAFGPRSHCIAKQTCGPVGVPRQTLSGGRPYSVGHPEGCPTGRHASVDEQAASQFGLRDEAVEDGLERHLVFPLVQERGSHKIRAGAAERGRKLAVEAELRQPLLRLEESDDRGVNGGRVGSDGLRGRGRGRDFAPSRSSASISSHNSRSASVKAKPSGPNDG
jgi:hypothetical protein